ncbi:hypothetical protein HBH56_244920 [Parastagonospora nodorum]|nr:hypothetical protein HBH56_244920 [Parastagonospora nodorum]KAH3921066.1 hypothetical protein HBH54_246720 [Parastagonospora nodorum]KAH4042487.1 hypothetical protein HBH49_249220 [Parastagonospora nodorum]KAH4123059.1 hypothetical protein HBH45_246780 [Parastagonospora nodorum]KAH4553442.1 hypothetical protein HBH84_247610 [Parastagonospora nodorum]
MLQRRRHGNPRQRVYQHSRLDAGHAPRRGELRDQSMGKCFNTVDNPAVTKGSVGQSFRIECCEGDGKGSCVFD